jgi:hypothetical protein
VCVILLISVFVNDSNITLITVLATDKFVNIKLSFLCAIAIALLPTTAQAATITHSTGTIAFDQDGETLDYKRYASVALPYFNPALGQLDSVSYNVQGTATATIALENRSTQTGFGYGYSQLYSYAYLKPKNFYFFGGDASAYASTSGTLSKLDRFLTTTTTTPWNYDSSAIGPSSSLEAFIGTGDFAMDFWGFFSGIGYAYVPRSSVDVLGQVNLTTNLTYNYTPVPAPALLPGAIALTYNLLRKRKRATLN